MSNQVQNIKKTYLNIFAGAHCIIDDRKYDISFEIIL